MTKANTDILLSKQALSKRLQHNRVELQDYLQDGIVPKKKGASGVQKAIRSLDHALTEQRDWAVRLALEYGVGKSQQFVHAMQEEDDGDPGFSIEEVRETVTATRTRRRTLPNVAS